MASTTFTDLKHKEVINICDGARLGTICDLELDECTGVISAIVVPGQSRMWGLIKATRAGYPILQDNQNRRRCYIG